jgi:GNAT superfamily N-acetyltransferase
VQSQNLSRFRVLDRYADVSPFLPDIVKASDSNRDYLGFVPRSVFDELARQHEIFALVNEVAGEDRYVGHLLFQRRYPKASVMQLFILEQYRQRGFASLLCDQLIERLTREGFTSIYARVGEDMRAANEAWQAMGFRVQRTELGGATTKRMIVVRVRELDSPQLFVTQKIDQADPLGLTNRLSTETPLFLLDLNVLFDLSPRRARHEDALTVFQAERANFCKLAISDEVIGELHRTGEPGRPDPMMNLARTFTRFPVSSAAVDGPLVLSLAKLVFPSKQVSDLSRNDISDIRHLVTAIENNLAGLITNDAAILSAAVAIEDEFEVQILSPKAFLVDQSSNLAATLFEISRSSLELLPVAEPDDRDLRSLLIRAGLKPVDLASGWITAASKSFVVRTDSKLVGFVSWPALKRGGSVTIRAAVDESSLHASEVARGVLMHALTLNIDGPTALALKVPQNQVVLREIARGLGFTGRKDTAELNKLCFGRVATKGNWEKLRTELAQCGLKMNTQLPAYRRIEQQMPYASAGGYSGYQTLEQIETLLSPALFCLPGRPAVITPIRHVFSNPLLGHSKQQSFLPSSTSQLFEEKHYISGPNAFRNLTRGTLMLFYESSPPRGKGELIAIARVRRSYLKEKIDLNANDLTQSVLNNLTLPQIGSSEIKCITVFDNLFPLPKPIQLSRLRELGCGQPTDLITSNTITDLQLQNILSEAFKE